MNMRIRTQICLVSFAFLIFGCSYFEKASVDNTISIERDALNPEPSFLRGKYLVESPAGCAGCHTPTTSPTGQEWDKRIVPVKGMHLGGKKMIDNIMMTVYAHNLTPGSRISNWSNEALKLSIREGIRPDGSLIGFPMPFHGYRKLSDSDAESMVLYLRNIPAVKNELPDSSYGVMNLLIPSSYGPKLPYIKNPSNDDLIERGKYIAEISNCGTCHAPTKMFFNSNGPGPDISKLYHGGHELKGSWGEAVAPNITSHTKALGKYSDKELMKIITKGIKPNGFKLSPGMNYAAYDKLNEKDLIALVAYLRTIPAFYEE